MSISKESLFEKLEALDILELQGNDVTEEKQKAIDDINNYSDELGANCDHISNKLSYH